MDTVETLSLPQTTWIISDDGQGLAAHIAERLYQEGKKVLLLAFPSSLVKRQLFEVETHYKLIQLKDASLECLESTMKEIMDSEDRIEGFIHVHPRHPLNIQQIKETFVENDYQIIKLVFFIAKHLSASFNRISRPREANFLAVTQLDGKLGLAKHTPFHTIPGALPGLTKSLAREWKGVFARTIDISPQLEFPSAAKMICDELKDADMDLLEVGIDSEGQRWQPELIHTNIMPTPHKPDSNTVFLVSGGGRGITADCVVELAKNFRSKFVLLGRTAIQDTEPKWAEGLESEEKLKIASINHMKELKLKPRPVEIEKIIKAILSSREIKNTLEKIERYEGKAIYLNVDITNSDELKVVLAQAQKQLGVINAVIHGAGNLADKKIQNKDDKDFSLVFNTKIKSLENLVQLLDPKQLEYLILFSSVAGYFGNMGQSDYAMANEVLNKFSHCFHMLHPEKHVTSINWGPWDSGMMKADLKKLYKEKGIDIISREEGSMSCVDEFLSSDKPAQILLTRTLALPLEAPLAETIHSKIKRKLSIKDNPFLNDHIVAGHPVLPATCAINWMIKNCTDIVSKEYKFKWLKNFKVLKGLIFTDHDTKEYITELKISSSKEEGGELIAHVTIYSQAENSRSFFHYSAEIGLTKIIKAQEVLAEIDLKPDYKISTTQEEIYSKHGFLFHEKSFKGVEEILNIDHKKITVKCRLLPIEQSVCGQFQVNSFNPYIADIQLHPALIYSLFYLSKKCLPAEFEKIEQFQTIDFNQHFYLSLIVKSQNNIAIIFDIVAHNEQGSVYQKWTGAKFILKNY